MKHHLTAIITIIVCLVVGGLFLRIRGVEKLFNSKSFFFLDSDPAQIVVPQEGGVYKSKTDLRPVISEVRVFQFDQFCDLAPATLAVPMGSQVTIRNNSGTDRTVTIGPKNYISKRWSDIEVTINDVGTYEVGCDGRSQSNIIVTQ